MKKRPKSVPSTSTKVKVGCGSLYVTIGVADGEIIEVFAVLGKAGGCATCFLKSVVMCIAIGIRGGAPVEDFIKHLIGQRCPTLSIENGITYLSCSDAIGQILRDRQKELKSNMGE